MHSCSSHSSLERDHLFRRVLQQDEEVGGEVILAGSEQRERRRERHELARGARRIRVV